ncbi:MAG: hypothetical protein CL946_02965 [Ectothiorhodospiraceae bacterium]|nr:hypothetical protein [Ectothiorhodospiraceae bacterium]
MIITALFALALLAGTSYGQNSNQAMFCTTQDGIVKIQNNTVELRDYTLTAERVERDGVIHLIDANAGVTAVLDARDPQGLYLAVNESGIAMQVVAPSRDINVEGSTHTTSGGAAPSGADINIIREIHTSHSADMDNYSALAR